MGVKKGKGDLEAIAGARGTCATLDVKADASTAEPLAHIGKIKIMANRGEELPATIIFGERVLVLATCNTETLSNVHVQEETFQWG